MSCQDKDCPNYCVCGRGSYWQVEITPNELLKLSNKAAEVFLPKTPNWAKVSLASTFTTAKTLEEYGKRFCDEYAAPDVNNVRLSMELV